MGNTITKKSPEGASFCEKYFTDISQKEYDRIRSLYTIIDVDYLNIVLVNYNMFNNPTFTENPKKKEVVDNMLHYYLSHKDKAIYKKTDLLCNDKEQICICNTHADDFRKIYDGVNYRPNKKYISWFEQKDPGERSEPTLWFFKNV